jgi:2-haloacid dehalogenase
MEALMSLDRRGFLNLVAAGIAAGFLTSTPLARAATKSKIKAIVFDGFALWDPRPISALAEQLFPGKGAELSNAWRTRQFDYQWLRVLTGRYADFWQATDDALVFSTEMLKLDLTPDKHKQLMNAYLELKAWPDVLPALQSMKSMGIRLAPLSNLTAAMLDADIKSSGLDGIFDKVLSTDKIKTYKPDPRAYRMAIDAYKLKRNEILFIPSSGWDAVGAKSFGYTTFWVNRLNLPAERLGVTADAVGQTLTDMTDFVKVAR